MNSTGALRQHWFLFQGVGCQVAPVVRMFNPFPELLQVQGATIRPDIEQYQRLDWQAIGEQWVELTYTLARQAREDQDGDAFVAGWSVCSHWAWFGMLGVVAGTTKCVSFAWRASTDQAS